MDNNGQQWTTIDNNGYQWITMDNININIRGATCPSDAVLSKGYVYQTTFQINAILRRSTESTKLQDVKISLHYGADFKEIDQGILRAVRDVIPNIVIMPFRGSFEKSDLPAIIN